MEAPVETPDPKTKLGLLGATVSRVKLVLPTLLTLPAISVVLAVTLITPSVKVLRSLPVNITAWDTPLPVKVFVTLLVPFVKMTLTAEPLSAVTFTTPLACVASVIEDPAETPVPKTKLGLPGLLYLIKN